MNEDFQADFQRVFGLDLAEAYRSESDDDLDDDNNLPGNSPSKKADPPKPTNEDVTMSKELLEQFSTENASLKGQLADALKVNESHLGTIGSMEEKAKAKNKDIEDLEKKVADSDDTKEQHDALMKDLDDLGSPEEVRETFAKMRDYLAELKDKAGSTDEALELLDMANEVFGDGDNQFGSVDEIRQAYSMMRDFIERMKPLGTPEDIEEVLLFSQHQAESTRDALVEGHAIRLAEELGVNVDIVTPMVEKGLSDAEIQTAFKKITESTHVRNRYQTGPVDNKDEGGKPNPMSKTPGQRLLESTQGRLNK
jgi:hypothetical protein